MKKVKIQHLQLTKQTISSLKTQEITGGNSRMCTSSVDPHECYFACASAPQTVCEC